jgi:Secretion system C-terminal sorting domain
LADSASAWYNVKRGIDTTWNAFEYYGSLQLGADNRMYIGKVGGGFKQFSVIDYPDLKGSACGFCRKCFRVDNALGGLNSPPNVPDFNLGADASLLPCWPLSNEELIMKSEEWVVYPNPSNTTLTIKNKKGKKKELYNSVGQMIYSTTKEVIDVSGFSKVIYFIKVEGEVKKVVVE